MKVKNYERFWVDAEKTIDKDALDIVLLANVLEPRGHANISQIQCANTERFSTYEFDEIYRGIVNAGYFISETYFNELDFIQRYSAEHSFHNNALIYNLMRNGAGYDKKVIIPAFCDLLNLKYISSSAFTCSLCRNKFYFTKILESNHIPVPQTWLKAKDNSWIGGAPPEDMRVILKPCSASASQGINSESIIRFSQEAVRNLGEIIVQEYIDGYECEVPIIKIKNVIYTLPPTIIDLGKKMIMDENASNNYEYSFVSGENILSPQCINSIEYTAEKAFSVLKIRNYGRIDFRITKDGEIYIFDVATSPYTIRHSSYAASFGYLGLAYEDIYKAIITAAFSVN